MIAIRGASSAIAQAFVGLLEGRDTVVKVGRRDPMPNDAERFLFCGGFLAGKRAGEITADELRETTVANCTGVIAECDRLLARNASARVCIIGSESGISGSFDMAYAAAKAGLHLYVETKRLQATQQLICVAPSIVGDAGMTLRRKDAECLERRRAAHPKGRFLTAIEVARVAIFALYLDHGYLTNTVIRMNGGEHTCR
jgi:NAD(P)-dependent dehydrogenase (short-subunit alcohol dehydrogenase family)